MEGSLLVRRAHIPDNLRVIGRLRDACGLSGLNDFLALRSQAHLPSLLPAGHIDLGRHGRTRPGDRIIVVTHRYQRAHCLWLEQFQIAEYARRVDEPGAQVAGHR
jgi:hypothetical protein